MTHFEPATDAYDTLEEIPRGTVHAVRDGGTLYLQCAGAEEEWISASLAPRNVSANTANNR